MMREDTDTRGAVLQSMNHQKRHVGHSARKRKDKEGSNLISVIAAEIFLECNGTISFDPFSAETKQFGFSTIWEQIAWRYPVEELGRGLRRISEPTPVARGKSVAHHAKQLARGFSYFRDYHQKGWGVVHPIHFVPRTLESKIIIAITWNPAFELPGGKTALEMAKQRNFKTIKQDLLHAVEKAARLGEAPPEFISNVRKSLKSLQSELDVQPKFDFEFEAD